MLRIPSIQLKTYTAKQTIAVYLPVHICTTIQQRPSYCPKLTLSMLTLTAILVFLLNPFYCYSCHHLQTVNLIPQVNARHLFLCGLGHGTINVNGDLWHTWTPTHTSHFHIFRTTITRQQPHTITLSQTSTLQCWDTHGDPSILSDSDTTKNGN
jgi:hypothetical protein